MPQTLGALIAAGTFPGLRTTDASWRLDAEEIETLLHDRSYGDFSRGDQHCAAFYDAERLTAVEIHTWTCTDTLVGLQVLRLDGMPVALSWQPYRKSDHEVALLSGAARDHFVARWEAHRPAPERPGRFVSPNSLSLPVADPGDPEIEIDEQSPVEHLRPSLVGAAQWLEAIRPRGGIEAVTDRGLLVSCRAGAQADIDLHQGLLDSFAALRVRDGTQDEADSEEEREARGRIGWTKVNLVDPIDRRLAELGAA